jgi:hypothetical protein
MEQIATFFAIVLHGTRATNSLAHWKESVVEMRRGRKRISGAPIDRHSLFASPSPSVHSSIIIGKFNLFGRNFPPRTEMQMRTLQSHFISMPGLNLAEALRRKNVNKISFRKAERKFSRRKFQPREALQESENRARKNAPKGLMSELNCCLHLRNAPVS